MERGQPCVVAVGELNGHTEEGRVGAIIQVAADIAGGRVDKVAKVLGEGHVDVEHEVVVSISAAPQELVRKRTAIIILQFLLKVGVCLVVVQQYVVELIVKTVFVWHPSLISVEATILENGTSAVVEEKSVSS